MSVMPLLTYDDAPAAIAFLTEAFGFEERYRIPMPDGRLGYAELARGDAVIALASAWPELGHAAPKDLPAVHTQIVLTVDDVDAHHAHAAASGATIDAPPEDQFHGHRTYRARDPEGHRWMVQQVVREMTVAEIVAAMG